MFSKPRQLPLYIYMLLDVSASMHGLAIEALKNCYHELTLQRLEQIFEERELRLSVLGYHSRVDEYQRHMLPHQCPLPMIEAAGTSALGEAFIVLTRWRQEDNLQSPGLVLLFTDGPGTDHWFKGLRLIKDRQPSLPLVGMGCGPKNMLPDLAPYLSDIFNAAEIDGGGFKKSLKKLAAAK